MAIAAALSSSLNADSRARDSSWSISCCSALGVDNVRSSDNGATGRTLRCTLRTSLATMA